MPEPRARSIYRGPNVEDNRYVAAISRAYENLGKELKNATSKEWTGQQLLQVLEKLKDHFIPIYRFSDSAIVGYVLIDGEVRPAYDQNGRIHLLSYEEFKKIMFKCRDSIERRPEYEREGFVGPLESDAIDHTIQSILQTGKRRQDIEDIVGK